MKNQVAIVCLSLTLASTALADSLAESAKGSAECGQVLVSDFTANNVVVLDGCDGSFVRLLDTAGRMVGPQAMRLRDGMIYVVSEDNARILCYRVDDLTFVDIFAQDDPTTAQNELGVSRPTGLDFGPDGDVYVSGFNSDNVVRLDGSTGAMVSEFVPTREGGLDGPDAGMVFGPDGNLYVPGFESDSVVRFNGQTGALIDQFVPAGGGGLGEPRVVLFDDDRMLVTGYSSNRIHEFDPDTGAFVRDLANAAAPTGIARQGDRFLIASDRFGQIGMIDANDGTNLGAFSTAAQSGISAATFILVLGGATQQASNEQFWIVGAGEIAAATLDITEAVSTTGGVFGPGFDADAIVRPAWGRVVVTLTSCTTAELIWESVLPEYGNGGYPLQRVGPNSAQRQCEAMGFDAANVDADWFIGSWFGGPERSGEGLLIDALEGGLGFLAWFSYTAG